jgi:PAB1-binding protein PBP1
MSGNSFRTDTAISGNRHQGERTLKRWVPDESIETDSSLESARNKSSSAGWDQFAANERLFGLKTDYDETIYTTPIDKSHPEYDRRYAEADKKAREIENSLTNNRHVAEERITDNVTADGSGLDEEDK